MPGIRGPPWLRLHLFAEDVWSQRLSTYFTTGGSFDSNRHFGSDTLLAVHQAGNLLLGETDPGSKFGL